MPDSLALVSSVAGQLLEATASTAAQVSGQVLASLVEQFDLDYSFLRHNDHDIGASVLVAEWPPRPNVPDPDPLAVVHFSSADPVFALGERGKKSLVIKPDQMEGAYRHWIAERRHVASPTVAVAPLVARHVTTGALGIVKFGGRKWKPEVISTLEAVACMFAGVQARTAAEQKLRYLADHDDLTGLLNRRALVAHLADRLAAGRPGPVPMLYIDLDRLKAINDCFGHTVGDWFIQIFAERLRTSAGNPSMIARLGGDEFVVVPDRPMPIDTAELLADQLLTAVRERLSIGGHTITRTVSIGVAVGVPGRDDGTDLLHRADEAVMAAKRAGGNQVAVSDDISLKRLFRNDIELHLQGDIDSQALLLHYLPEVDLRSGAIVAAEALVRWQHPTRGLLLPDSFIGIAESMDLAGELGRWVLRNACAEFSGWRSRGVGRDRGIARQCVASATGHPRFRPQCCRHHPGVWHRRRLTVPRDHRARSGSRHRKHTANPRGVKGSRGPDRHRRLRHRLRCPVAPEITSNRYRSRSTEDSCVTSAPTPTISRLSARSSDWLRRSIFNWLPRASKPRLPHGL